MYFQNFPITYYSLDDTSTAQVVTNIALRIKLSDELKNNLALYDEYDIKDGEKRAFPYMGNTPTITLKEEESSSFMEILTLTLYQVVNNLYQRELLKSFEAKFRNDQAEFVTITSPPELFNYIDLYKMKLTEKKKLIVLYPEPPLGAEELRILNDIDKDIKFVTPIYLPTWYKWKLKRTYRGFRKILRNQSQIKRN